MPGKRLNQGGRIDRSDRFDISFNGETYSAYRGDTLASALLASGSEIVARSFKYHRPRGVFSAGVEEPNALVQLRNEDRHEPNVRATTTEVFEGLIANSQNAWPNVNLDIGILNNFMSPFLSAGFYYKTFIGPFKGTKFWMFCEDFIRKAAGMGVAKYNEDPDSYEKINAFCDLLIIGTGPAGLSAALAAGRAGLDVILVEQDFDLGGSLLSDSIDSKTDQWLQKSLDQLLEMDNVRILSRTTAFGAYEGDTYALIEDVNNHTAETSNFQVRQRYWLVKAKRSILASGALERPLVFGNNDIPGVMLAGSLQTYLNRFAVLPGENILLTTNNDSVYQVAIDLKKAGASVTVCDMRSEVSKQLTDALTKNDIEFYLSRGVISAIGNRYVRGAKIVKVGLSGQAVEAPISVECDCIGVSGGWSPTLHVWSQLYGKPVYDQDKSCFIPNIDEKQSIICAGGTVATDSMQEALNSGEAAAKTVIDFLLTGSDVASVEKISADKLEGKLHSGSSPLLSVTDGEGKTLGKAFLDLQHDVKATDIEQAHLEGYVSVEHLKRYTTTGMATDQGKTSNMAALSQMAKLRQKSVPETGTTTFRPPYTPITWGAVAAREHGAHFKPNRLTPMHDWHLEHGAKIIDAGLWSRAWYYPKGDETIRDAYIREAKHVRDHVGMVDVTTLGKIAVQGPDAAEFLNRMYVNGWKTLKVGHIRYGIMLREDGIVMDDGATARLGENDYFMTTTTANAAKVLSVAEKYLQTYWKDLKVHVTSITDQWAAMAVAGPKSRELLQSVVDKASNLDKNNLGNNQFVEERIADVDVRIHRMSFSGELAYEVYVPSGFGRRVWEAIYNAGKKFNLIAYGTESMGTLRIEKGHVAGPELDGRTTLADMGLGGFASKKKSYIGSVLKERPFLSEQDRQRLVGLEIEGDIGALPGCIIYSQDGPQSGFGDGWVSSTTYSPALGKNIAMGFVKDGPNRKGEKILIVDHLSDRKLTAKITSHHFFDPEGDRQNG